MKKILAFSGSNSKKSINQSLIKAVAKLSTKVQFDIISLIDYPAPLYGIDHETENGIPENMIELSALISAADGLVIATPEHNGTTTAVMKNTIDWLSRIEQKLYANKPVVFLSTSPGARGGAGALSYFTNAAPYQGGNVIGSRAVSNFQDHIINDEFVEGEEKKALEEIINSFIKSTL